MKQEKVKGASGSKKWKVRVVFNQRKKEETTGGEIESMRRNQRKGEKRKGVLNGKDRLQQEKGRE